MADLVSPRVTLAGDAPLVHRDVVLQHVSSNAASAVVQSLSSFEEFQKAFASRKRHETDFIVTAAMRSQGELIPVGIRVTRLDADRIEGIRVLNSFEEQSEVVIQCELSNVIDWRYTKALRLVGGHLFNEHLASLPAKERDKLLLRLPFSPVPVAPAEPRLRAFFDAISEGDDGLVKLILENNAAFATAQAEVPCHSHSPGRHVELCVVDAGNYAAEFGTAAVVDCIIAAGSTLTQKDHELALCVAALNGNAETTSAYLRLEINANCVGPDGSSPLAYAIRNCYPQVVQILLDAGANVNTPDRLGRTPLFVAKDISTIELLIASGADVGFSDNLGRTADEYHTVQGRLELASAIQGKRHEGYESTNVATSTPLANSDCYAGSDNNVISGQDRRFGLVLPIDRL